MTEHSFSVDWGTAGLTGTLGYRIVAGDGNEAVARTTAGIAASPTSSTTYRVSVEIDDDWVGGEIIWDDGSGNEVAEKLAATIVTGYASGMDPASQVLATPANRIAANGSGQVTPTTTPPTAAQIRAEMDSNSTKLANLDAQISTRATPAQVESAVNARPNVQVKATVG